MNDFKNRSHLRKLAVLIAVLLVGYLIYFVSFTVGASIAITSSIQTVNVSSQTMSPAIVKGQEVYLAKYPIPDRKYSLSLPINSIVAVSVKQQYGSLAVKANPHSGNTILSRVVALAGDRVVISHGHVTVYDSLRPNGFNPSLSYEAPGTITAGNVNMVVPPGYVYLLGDNRSLAMDSRYFGAVPVNSITGIYIGTVK